MLNNEFVFPNPEPPSVNIVWMIMNLWPIWIMFFYVFFCNIIEVNHFLYCFIILLHLISSFLLTRPLLVPYAYVSIESIDCFLLLSFELRAIFFSKIITSFTAKSALRFYFDLLFLMKFLWFFFKTIFVNYIFFRIFYLIFKFRCF